MPAYATKCELIPTKRCILFCECSQEDYTSRGATEPKVGALEQPYGGIKLIRKAIYRFQEGKCFIAA
jgi:hypothetical protein